MLRTSRFIAVFISVLALSLGTLWADEPKEIRVVTWNLEWFPGRAPKSTRAEKDAQITAVRAALAELKPDILVLQEVREEESVKLALQDLPGMEIAVFSKFDGAQQLAIATKLPVNAAWTEEWERTGKDDPPRGFDFAAIELPGPEKRLLLAYTFHFKSNHGGDKRMQSNIAKREAAGRQLGGHMEKIADHFVDQGKISWLLAGDFNTSLDDPRFESEATMRHLLENGLKWSFEGIPATERETLPAEGSYPAITFDHILFRDLELVSVKVPHEYALASDHRPVLAVFKTPGLEADSATALSGE